MSALKGAWLVTRCRGGGRKSFPEKEKKRDSFTKMGILDSPSAFMRKKEKGATDLPKKKKERETTRKVSFVTLASQLGS